MNTTNTATLEVSESTAAADSKVLIGLANGRNEPENVLIAYLMGVEALRAGKEALMFLTKDGIEVAIEGFAGTIDVPDGPSVATLHEEYVNSGGRFFVCPVCVKVRGCTDAVWVENAEVKGAPSVYEYTAGGALVLNY